MLIEIYNKRVASPIFPMAKGGIVQNAYDKDDWVQRGGDVDGTKVEVAKKRIFNNKGGNAKQTIDYGNNINIDAPGDGGYVEHSNIDSKEVLQQINGDIPDSWNNLSNEVSP